jgi:hypothetical protein
MRGTISNFNGWLYCIITCIILNIK